MIINMEQFGRYFTDFKSSATRIETLPTYDDPDERENFEYYLTGAPLPADRNAEWAANIRNQVASGKYMGRVHIIDHVLNPYLQFEVDWYYAINGAAGEDIRFIFREDVPDLVYTDTWLFDDESVLDLSYDKEGCLLYINENDHPDRLVQARAAWQEFHRRSFPLAELLAMVRSNDLQVPRRSSNMAADATASQTVLRTDFVLNDQANGYPTRTVETTAARADIDQFLKDGFLPLKGLINAQLASELARSVMEIARAEEGHPRSECLPEQSIYIRGLFDKDAVFHQLLWLEPPLSLARMLLGPQLWVELEARMNYADRAGVAVPWHGHLPVIPDPLPPLFCYPHQVHCLIYLDRVTEREGALCLLPGSHMRPDIKIPLGDRSDQPGQVKLFFEPGDAVLIHANMWHQTVPSQANAGLRRLLLVGYVPSWIRNDGVHHGVRPDHPLTADLAKDGDPRMRELLGDLQW